MPSSGKALRVLVIAATVSAGLSFGIGIFTFDYAEGTSYFSKSPEACVNCHIMRPQYESWLKSSHKSVATCVDCHLPQDFVGKYLAKAENGWNHSKAFTLQNFHEPIMINQKNSRILQENCISCHQDLMHQQTSLHAFPDIDQKQIGQFTCVHCHAGAGHGEAVGMGVLDQHPGRAGLKKLREEQKKKRNNP